MSDFVNSGWAVYVTVVTVAGLLACLALLLLASRSKVQAGDDTTGHVWDVDIRELNNPLPRWWMWLFVGTILFSAVYLVMSTDGTGQFTENLNHLDAVYFTVTILATVGFGDVAALSQAARAVVTVQMLLDIAIVATLAKVILGAARLSLGRRPS